MATLQTKWYNTAQTAPTGGRLLLQGERYGFAIDATTATTTDAAYVGASYGGTVAIHADNVTDKPNIPMDAAAGLLKGASPLVQSGTSPKMVHFNASPYVRWSPHNYQDYSQDIIDGVGWTTGSASMSNNAAVAPDGTTTADKLIEDGTTNNHQVYNRLTLVVGQVYTWSVYAKAAGRTWCILDTADDTSNNVRNWFDLGNGVVGTNNSTSTTITSVGNGWYRLTATYTPQSTSAYQWLNAATANNTNSYAGDGSSGVYFWGAQCVRGYNANPYIPTTSAAVIGIPQSYDTAASKFGILVEPAATNLLLRSEALDNASWTKDTATVSANSVAAPDGATTADTIVSTGGDGQVYQAATTSNATVYTFSAYVKAAVNSWAFLYMYDGSSDYVGKYFDLTNGVVGSSDVSGWTLTGSSITAIGNGWYRCSITTTTETNTTCAIQIADANNDASTAASASIYAWGAQLELGSVATSYIPTLGSTVTRAVDKLSCAFASLPAFTSLSLVLWARWRHVGNTISIFASDENGVLRLQQQSTNFLAAEATNADVQITGLSVTGSGAASDAIFKGGGRYAANDTQVALNGSTGTHDTACSVPAMVTLGFGYIADTSYQWGGFLYNFTMFARALTDAELQAKTT